MNCQVLFSGKNEEEKHNNINLLSADLAVNSVKLKILN